MLGESEEKVLFACRRGFLAVPIFELIIRVWNALYLGEEREAVGNESLSAGLDGSSVAREDVTGSICEYGGIV